MSWNGGHIPWQYQFPHDPNSNYIQNVQHFPSQAIPPQPLNLQPHPDILPPLQYQQQPGFYQNVAPSNFISYDGASNHMAQYQLYSPPAPHPHAHPPPLQPVEYPYPTPLQPPPRQDKRPTKPRPPTPKKQVEHVEVNVPVPVGAPDPPVEYRLLLLSLADGYIDEAHTMSSQIALGKADADVDQYYTLLATGLRCYEAVLKSELRLLPRQEALAQLRYATILYEETENEMEIESILTKGVALCERNRLTGLKYAMQHLLARSWHKSKPGAAAKYLNQIILEAETQQHTTWVYVFRFLRATMLIESQKPQDTATALHCLKSISKLSKGQGDTAVHTMATIFETMIYLRTPHDESLVEAQRAIATIRSQQMDANSTEIPQFMAFAHFLDLACSLEPYKPSQAHTKGHAMQQFLDETGGIQSWHPDGTFQIPLHIKNSGNMTTAETAGMIVKGVDGCDRLTFSWLQKADAYALGYLLGGAALYSKNPLDGHKSEKFLKEGLKTTTDAYRKNGTVDVLESVSQACAKSHWRRKLRCYMLAQLTFARCECSDWSSAKEYLTDLKKAIEAPGFDLNDSLKCLSLYLDGIISQGSDDLDAAMRVYADPLLALPEHNKRAPSTFRVNLALLATLNTVLITRNPTHPSHALTFTLLERLAPYFPPIDSNPASSSSSSSYSHPNATTNPHLIASNLFLHAALPQSPPSPANPSHMTGPQTTMKPKIITTKSHLQSSLHLAKSLQNNQLISLCLSYMCHAFFRGIVGEQPVQAASAARKTAAEAGSTVWKAVADEMLVASLEVSGRAREADGVRREMEALVEGLAFQVE